MCPLDAFIAQAQEVRTVADPASLDPLFFKRVFRKVNPDATLSLNNRLYEVPPRYVGQRVEVRFDPSATDEIHIYKNDITPVLILDEMHMASNAFLNDISLLFNFSMDSENPFVLILAGLPHLMDRLKLAHNQPLMKRIVLRHHVQPLAKEDVRLYLDHHLKRVGAVYEIFTPQAVEAIAARSRGLPRVINNLATHSLFYGYGKQLRTIDEEAVFAITLEEGA